MGLWRGGIDARVHSDLKLASITHKFVDLLEEGSALGTGGKTAWTGSFFHTLIARKAMEL